MATNVRGVGDHREPSTFTGNVPDAQGRTLRD